MQVPGSPIVGIDARSSRSVASGGANALYQGISPGYFRTAGIKIIEGRDFDWRLDGEHTGVVVSERLARAIGRPRGLARSTIWVDGSQIPVVGVVANIRANVADGLGERPYLYYLSARSSPVIVRVDERHRTEAINRVTATIEESAGGTGGVWALDARQNVERFLAPHVSRVTLVGFQTAAALLLGIIGLYSLAREVLHERLRSAAVRKALGAPADRVVLHVSAPVVSGALIGIVLGLAMGIAAGRWMSSAGLIASARAALDLTAAMMAVVSVVVASLLALAGPARRAAHLDPSVLLRLE